MLDRAYVLSRNASLGMLGGHLVLTGLYKVGFWQPLLVLYPLGVATCLTIVVWMVLLIRKIG